MQGMMNGAQVAKLLGINRKTVRAHLNGRKIGRRVLYSAAEIRQLMGDASANAVCTEPPRSQP